MEKPLVTILTPTYNREDLIAETIESVLSQDYPNIEYLILDDGSKDNTREVVAKFGDRVRYLYHDNVGETATVNKGFSLARGEIICVINSDDPFFTRSAITTAVKHLQEHPDALMAYPDWVGIDREGKELYRRSLPLYSIENMLESVNVALGPGMFIRRTAIEKIGPRNPSIKYTGDLDYSFRLAHAGKIIHIPEFLATHRVHASSLSSSAKGRRMAFEVLSLGLHYLDPVRVPASLRNRRNRLIARWYLKSMYFLGFDVMTATQYFGKAIWHSPAMTAWMIYRKLREKSLVYPYKIWGAYLKHKRAAAGS